MHEISLRETRDLLKQIREDALLRPSGLRPVHLIHVRRSGPCGDTAAVRSGEENHVLDGDRSMADGRDILEFELQKLVRKVWNDARKYGDMLYYARADKEVFFHGYDFDIHKLLISHLDGSTSDVGTQDEAPEAGTVGDGVRPKFHLIPRDPNAFVVDEWDPIKKITDDFAREMDLHFARAGKKVAMGHCNLTKNPDGSIHASINFFPQNPR